MSGSGCHDYRSGIGRRAFLGAGVGGGLGIGSLGIASDGVIDLEDVPRDTAVIQYWLNGAASHFETYDPKPDAPLGIRSPFHPIATNVPGTFVCESLPLHARLMDKVTLIRSVHHDNSDHQHGMHWCQTGHDAKANGINPFKKSSHASSGCLVSMVRGPNHPGMPPYVFMGYPLDNQGPHRMYPHRGAYLPARFNPMEILIKRTGDGKLPAQDKDFVVRSLAPTRGLSRKDFVQRRELLARFEQIRGETDPVATASWTAFHDSAFNLVAGEKTGSAFDLEQEDETTRVGPTVGRTRSDVCDADRPRRGTLELGLGLPQDTRGSHQYRQPADGPRRDHPDQRPARAGVGQEGAGGCLGRIRSHSDHQQERRPRSLGQRTKRAAGRRELPTRAGDR